MFERILVPVDLTDKNRRALEMARDLALEGGGTVTVLHVIETLDLPFEEVEDFYDRLEARAVEGIDDLVAVLRDADVKHERAIRYGKRAAEIVEHAEEMEADIILLTSHRVDPEEPGSGWATISYKVAILAQGPVLLIK